MRQRQLTVHRTGGFSADAQHRYLQHGITVQVEDIANLVHLVENQHHVHIGSTGVGVHIAFLNGTIFVDTHNKHRRNILPGEIVHIVSCDGFGYKTGLLPLPTI